MAQTENVKARFAAYGWDVSAADGHDPEAVAAAIAAARETGQPSLIACKTVIGYGAPTKAGTAATHGAPLGGEEIAGTRQALGWSHAPFEVPHDVLAAWRDCGTAGAAARRNWAGRLASADAKLRGEFERAIHGVLPADLSDRLNAHKKAVSEERPDWATRVASGNALEVLVAAVPEMIGGSADLTGSNNTRAKAAPDAVSANDYGGRYIYYGVREHGMAAAMNGLALHGGIIPYSGTFLVFSDYMRPSLRLAALMGIRVVHVLTHDSIGLGEDGPTHQPVETLAALRAIPNLNVFRPADAVETAECWELALRARKTPSALALTRQGVPTLRTEHTDENLCARGGYVLAEADGERKVTLLATGSEVALAMAARGTLQADGIATAVVSLPCWELFDAEDVAYRASVLGPGTVRVAVEAAVRFGWDKYIGSGGGFVGMTGFGASAPAADLYGYFGITAEAVVEQARHLL
jgi:transketolase